MIARILLTALATTAAAIAAPVGFNIPAQRTDRALLAFASQAGAQFLAPSDPLRQHQSPEVKGSLEPEEAIARLLEGTGFVARKTEDGKFIVSALPTVSIAGQLLDENERPVQNARVVLEPVGKSSSTDRDGRFSFPSVPQGTYSIRTSPAGYQRLVVADVHAAGEGVVDIGKKTVVSIAPPIRMDPYIVQGARTGLPAAESSGTPSVAVAAGNMDLPRTRDDALPFAVYARDRIARSGAVTLNDYLRRELLEADPVSQPPEGNVTDTTDFAGSQNLTLRGFSTEETVILVNGRRLPEVLTNAGNPRIADVNFIPLSLVQQVQVLPVSSSALYTGTAVGGVINIVLRPDANATATEVSAVYTNALGGFDAPESSISMTHARSLLGGKMRFRMNYSMTETHPAVEHELGYHQRTLVGPVSIDLPLHRATPNIRSADGGGLFGPNTATVTSVAPGADGSGGLGAFSGRAGIRETALFDGPGGTAVSPESLDFPYGRKQSGRTYFATLTYDAFPWLQLGLEGSYGRQRINRGFDVLAVDLDVPASAPSNPFGRDVVVSLNEQPSALGEGFSEAHVDAASVVGGAIVRLPSDWRATFDLQYGRNVTEYRGIASNPDVVRWEDAIAAGRYNPFRDTQVYNPPQEFYDRILIYRGARGSFVKLGDYETIDAAVRLANERLFLPTGPAKLNLGVDYARNHIASLVDQSRYGDGSPAGPPTNWSGRTVQRQSVFGELQASVLPARLLPRFIESAETDVAARYIFSSNARESNFAPTYGVKLGFAGGIAFRGSITTSNRLPTPRLSRPTVAAAPGSGTSFSVIFDPARNESYNINESEVIDPRLRPEEATTQTAGLIWEHGRTHHIRLSLDFTETRKVDELAALNAQTVMNLESLFPDRVIRDPATGGLPGPVRTVFTGSTNLAWRNSQNWTGSLDYGWTGPWGGILETYARFAYMSKYKLQFYPDWPVVDEVSAPDGLVPNLLKYRANLGAGWSNKSYATGLESRYYHSRILPLAEQSSQGADRIGSYWEFDAYLQTDLGRWLPWEKATQGLRGQIRIDNIFDAGFPRYSTERSGAGVEALGDWRGRTYSASVTAAF